MGMLRTLLVPFVVALLAFSVQLVIKSMKLRGDLNKGDFPAGNYSIGQIPTTRYSVGKIGEVLPQWHHDFHLYRVKDGEDFTIDKSKISSEVRAKSLANECKWNSVLCLPCFNSSKSVTSVTTDTIFNEPGWYASFAKISDSAVETLWNMLKLPFDLSEAQLEHAFISNLEEDMITAAMHANPITSSMAIQFLGRKTWIFFPRDTYIAEDAGFGAIPASPILLPRRAPGSGKPYELFVYTSEPGDVLFFPESYAHIVYTYAGPSVMVNYRKFYSGNVLNQPLTWLMATFNMVFFSELTHSAGRVAGSDLQQLSVPEKKLNQDTYAKLDGLCGGGTITGFDQQMVDLLEAEAKNYK